MAMWRPPQRIRYMPDAGRWPSAAEAQSARLFTAIQVNSEFFKILHFRR
jgi:hypothetical protein